MIEKRTNVLELNKKSTLEVDKVITNNVTKIEQEQPIVTKSVTEPVKEVIKIKAEKKLITFTGKYKKKFIYFSSISKRITKTACKLFPNLKLKQIINSALLNYIKEKDGKEYKELVNKLLNEGGKI